MMQNWLQSGRYFALLSTLCLGLLAGCQQASAPAAHSSRSNASPASEARAAIDHPAAGEPAPDFNYYMLTLSWSPEYCHGHPNSPQCGGQFPGFVVHGLWPQRNSGQWPADCSNAPGLANPSTMLDIMPDPRLIAHEWATHGTCSGLTPNQYFGLVRKAYDSIKIPTALTRPTRTTTQSASGIKQMFTDANLGLTADDIAISCHNRYLSAVEFCLSRSLQPIACQAVRDCNARSIKIPAAR